MNIYAAHPSSINYHDDYYQPLQESLLNTVHNIVYPHDTTEELFNSKKFFHTDCDLVIAEVSEPSTGLGIELGWANDCNLPIICVHTENTTPTSAISAVSDTILTYKNSEQLITKLTAEIDSRN